MAETIINSNQVRASGDTSTQTLIGANQIRQSGDSSSQTLLNKNQIASGGGVEFKTSIYSQGEAYIDTMLSDIDGYNIEAIVTNYPGSSGPTSNYVVGALTGSSGHQIGNCMNISYHPTYGSIFSCNYFNNSFANIYRMVNLSTKPQEVSLNLLQIPQATAYGLNVFVFAGNINGNPMYFCNVIKIKNLQLFKGSIKVAELKPAIVNGESGMYDTVTETFHGNANSVGSLVCE